MFWNRGTLIEARFPSMNMSHACNAVHPLEACEPISTANLPEGTAWVGFAVRQRNCTFYDKTINVQVAGGQAIIIANDVPDGGPVGMDYRDGAYTRCCG